MPLQTTPLLDYAVSALPAEGEYESGDACQVTQTDRGVLAAVVDGAGHGTEAATAARLAVETLEANSNEGLIRLMVACHRRLKHTRGAVMSLAAFDSVENTVTWLGVGNIEGILLRRGRSADEASETIFLRPGILGYRLPPLKAAVLRVAPGDLLILFTDGIRSGFTGRFSVEDPPSRIATYISSNFQRGGDDGLVLVARYTGANP